MAVLPVGTVTTPFVPGGSGVSGVSGISGISGIGTGQPPAPGFGEMLSKGLESATAAQDTASATSTKLATGELTDLHEFTTAAAKASLAVSMTSNVRNRAVEAYQEIMRMQV